MVLIMEKQIGLNKTKLAEELTARRWNYSDLSRAMNISRQSLQVMLAESNSPRVETIGLIADALGVNYKTLLL